jgi:transposase
MPNYRRKYDEEFKKRAVRMSYSSERTVKAVAESLGICTSILNRWRKKYTPDGDKTQLAEQQDELGRLRSRVAELEEENDILKKASAYFAKNQKR